MTEPRDVQDVMQNLLLDRGTADRLLSGSVAPDDAPPGYAGVATLLRSCAQPLPLDDARERTTILAMKQRIGCRPAEPSVSGRPAGRWLRLKLVGVGVGALLVSTSGLAFAGGLPAPAQRVVASGPRKQAAGERPEVETGPAHEERQLPTRLNVADRRCGIARELRGGVLLDRLRDVDEMVGNAAAIGWRRLVGADVESAKHGGRIAVDDLAAMPFGQGER